jgi:Rrf2 family protein
LKVTAKAEYACLALIELAHQQFRDGPVRLGEIARAQGLPQSTLTQVMLKMKGAGLVRSSRGSEGGYRLARPPEEIKLAQILELIDGGNGAPRALRGASGAALASVWREIREFESRVLAQTSIAQLAGEFRPATGSSDADALSPEHG